MSEYKQSFLFVVHPCVQSAFQSFPVPCFSLRAVNVVYCRLWAFYVRAQACEEPQKLFSFISLVSLVINFTFVRLFQSSK